MPNSNKVVNFAPNDKSTTLPKILAIPAQDQKTVEYLTGEKRIPLVDVALKNAFSPNKETSPKFYWTSSTKESRHRKLFPEQILPANEIGDGTWWKRI